MERREVGEYLTGVSGRVGYVVDLADDPFGIDEVADSLREIGEGVIGGPPGIVSIGHRLVGVAQQAEWEVELLGECQIVGWGVEGDAERDAVDVGELLGLITQAPSLSRSTRRVSLGVPPHQHPLSPVVVEGDRFTGLVGRRERGSGGVD